jgi:hypothetical protein
MNQGGSYQHQNNYFGSPYGLPGQTNYQEPENEQKKYYKIDLTIEFIQLSNGKKAVIWITPVMKNQSFYITQFSKKDRDFYIQVDRTNLDAGRSAGGDDLYFNLSGTIDIPDRKFMCISIKNDTREFLAISNSTISKEYIYVDKYDKITPEKRRKNNNNSYTITFELADFIDGYDKNQF